MYDTISRPAIVAVCCVVCGVLVVVEKTAPFLAGARAKIAREVKSGLER